MQSAVGTSQARGPEMLLVGYTFRGRPARVGFEAARACGYDGVELRNFSEIDFRSVEGVQRSLEVAAALASETGVPVRAAFISPVVASEDSAEQKARLSFYEAVLPLLGQAGVSLLHVQVQRLRSVQGKMRGIVGLSARDEDFDAAAQALEAVGRVASDCGVVVAVESHMGTIHDLACAQHRLISRVDLPSVAASLDFCNLKMVHDGEDLDEVIEAFAGRIGYVHCKNLVRNAGSPPHWNVSLAHGHLDYGRLVERLTAAGFAGPYAIEYCGPGDPHVYAREDADYLRSVFERVASQRGG